MLAQKFTGCLRRTSCLSSTLDLGFQGQGSSSSASFAAQYKVRHPHGGVLIPKPTPTPYTEPKLFTGMKNKKFMVRKKGLSSAWTIELGL